MRAVENRIAMGVRAVHELAEQTEKARRDYMENRQVDMDKVIAEGYGRRKKTSSGGRCIKC
jgi:hypothetical protein